MKDIAIADVRNFVIMGHTGSGKTAIVDAILHKLGINDRHGSTDDGSSMADWTDEEKERKISIWTKPFDAVYKKNHLVFMDTPGYADFYGQVVAASSVADAALITVDAASGVQVGTNRSWRRCEALGLPRGIVVTGIDKDNTDFTATLKSIQDIWGATRCLPATIPTSDKQSVIDVFAESGIPADMAEAVETFKGSLIESAAESNDALLEKYLGGEALAPEEINEGLRGAVCRGELIPVFAVCSKSGLGLEALMDGIVRYFPSPIERPEKDAAGEPVDTSPDAPFVGKVWRSVADPFVGQLTYLRVYGGTLSADSEIYNATSANKERFGTLYAIRGKKQDSIPSATAGDIVAIAKLKHTALNATLCAIGTECELPEILFPNP
ncbi:MAG: GTP-binding protein, partial [Kiritimatiellae bacterium]|nr:GTP-binding protein [Kiritimatiellia bacterium]